MAAPVLSGDDKPSRWGFIAALIVSAAAHVAFFILVLVILPGYLYSGKEPPPAYTVKIVDQLPAGDLGTHLPRLAHETRHVEEHHRPRQAEPPKPPEPSTPLIPPKEDKNVIALNTRPGVPTPTPTPPPPPEPTPQATATPHPKPAHHPRPTPKPRPAAKPTPKISRRAHQPREKPKPTPEVIAKAEPTPSIKQKMEKVREQLLAEHLKEVEKEAAEKRAAQAKATTGEGGGPVEASAETPGKGFGVGPGGGSAGIQQDADFLLYYQQVQDKIKKAWSFGGDNPELTATVTFGINPDGTLSSIKVSSSSRDPSFDDSVVRAIRRAAPFPPPPEKYRSQFAEGVDAVFKLAELSS